MPLQGNFIWKDVKFLKIESAKKKPPKQDGKSQKDMRVTHLTWGVFLLNIC